MRAQTRNLAHAFALLGLHGPTDGEALTRAFREAVKAARPDMPGGDAERFRRVIAAYRLIQKEAGAHIALAAPVAAPASLPVIGVTVLEALTGTTVGVRLGTRTLLVSVPAGMRTGDHLRLRGGADDGADLHLPVLVRPGDGLAVLGGDIHMDWPTAPRLFEDGGRVEIETHAGPRSAWVARGLTGTVCLRLRGLGLPARGAHAAGHLFVTLIPSEDIPSAAEDLLARFTRVWTPERLAA